jgi:hypothetical protein
MLAPTSNIALLGFGTRAAAFAALLAPRGNALRAWDPSLALTGGNAMRTIIEAAGVDCSADLVAALRGARLVVLDTLPRAALPATLLQAGQQVLDLDTAAATEVDAVLAALGLPATAPHWATVGAAAVRGVANSAAATPGTPPVRRGELP